MPDTKPGNNEEQKPTNTLRKSPRFLHVNSPAVEYPETPNPPERKTHSDSFSTPLHSSIPKLDKGSIRPARFDGVANLSCLDSVKRIRACRFATNQLNECEITGSKCSTKPSNISTGLNNRANVSEQIVNLDLECQVVKEKRVSSEKVLWKTVTRGTRTKTTQSVKKAKLVISAERKVLEDGQLCTGKREMKKVQVVGEKRKRQQVDEDCHFVNEGWSEEQELALKRAYFTAKPTPQFWKKVAMMVPGKSAEDCFNKIQSDHLTPSEPKTRSRVTKKQSSPVPFASKLLSPAETKPKRQRSQRRTLLAQKTVRHLLQKQHNEDQDYKADLFSVLEPNTELSPLNFQESPSFTSPVSNRLARCLEMSSPDNERQVSRISNSQEAGFVSPPVLKQIKNKALHEKYIDQLHCRDVKRKAQSSKNGRFVREKDNAKSEVNSVKFAKDALVFDMQDAISMFRNLQSSVNGDGDDDDINGCDEDEDDDEL